MFFMRSPKLSKQNCNYVRRYVRYVQGQSPKPNIREYFYYIDHQGQVRTVAACKVPLATAVPRGETDIDNTDTHYYY